MSRSTLARRLLRLAPALLVAVDLFPSSPHYCPRRRRHYLLVAVDLFLLLAGLLLRKGLRHRARSAWWRLRLWAALRRYRLPPGLRRWVANRYAEALRTVDPWRMARDALWEPGAGGGGAHAERAGRGAEDLWGREVR